MYRRSGLPRSTSRCIRCICRRWWHGGTFCWSRQSRRRDDKVDEGKLSDGFAWTSKMYRRATNGGIYSECTSMNVRLQPNGTFDVLYL
jgi:hypothetical protein